MRGGRVISPFRSILARETALERFPSRGSRGLPVAAGYPAPYRIGMSNLGFHFLYAGLRRSPGVSVERFFSDTSPLTLETGSPLSSASVIFFSISYEEDYLNAVRILHEAGVPARRIERTRGPLVIAGGPAVSANPAPFSAIADAIALGEGEGTLDEIIRLLGDTGELARDETLVSLAGLPGVLVPGAPGRSAGYREPIACGPFSHSTVITPDTVFPDMLLVESGRGCPGACAFCLATSLYRPFRYLRRDALEETLSRLAAPVRRVGLVSPAVAANPEFGAIVGMLRSRGIAVSTSSLRAEDLDEETARIVGEAGTASVSLAPESGSERVRYLLGKRTPNELYFNVAARLRESGVNRFTLYLLVGCPGEDDDVIPATKTFMEGFKKAIGGMSFSVHVNALVPKPWTPLQFHAMPDEGRLEEIQGRMASMLRGLGLRPRMKSARSAVRQALLSIGDEKIGEAIVLHVERGLSWRKALGEAGVDSGMPHARKGPDASFPWNDISGPVRRDVLRKRFESIAGGGPDGER